MYQKIKKIRIKLFLPVFLLFCMTAAVSAQGKSCTVSIPAEVQVAGEDAPSRTEFCVVLEALSEDAPMPTETSVTLDKGTAAFGPVSYTVPGDYRYKIYQIAAEQDFFTYDDTVYTVTVRVVNAENGALEAEIRAIEDGKSDKADAILFCNEYDPPVIETETETEAAAKKQTDTPKTGDETNLVLWAGLLAVSALIAAILAFERRRRKQN